MAARVSDEEMAATMKSHNEVVVFVQGFTGVSQTEMFSDLQRNWKLPEIFAREGFQTVLADVSPFNSNWDRACELYASLTGGKAEVDAALAAGEVPHPLFTGGKASWIKSIT
ncbi:Hypothetical Protein FCC1311_104331, partial [Hondaea fermentalgiana]